MEQYNNTLYIIGGASTALEIRETIEMIANSYDCIVNVIENGSSCRYSYIEDAQLEEHLQHSIIKSYIIGFTDQKLRSKYRELMEAYGSIPTNVIHPTALLSKSSILGVGNYMAAYSVLSAEARIGNHNIVNIATSLGHNTIIGNDNIFNPGTRISGCVEIGSRCLFGANSFVYQGVHVCSDCLIDTMTYLNQNLEEPSICTSNTVLKRYKNRLFNSIH